MMPFSVTRPQLNLPDEAESLQTDTMRFLALIVMCFMVVFALIPAIPMGCETEDELAARIERLNELDRQIGEKGNSLADITDQVKQKEKALEELEQQMAKREEKSTGLHASSSSPLKKEHGLTLRFASDKAMISLLKRSVISLYVLDGRTWFCLYMVGDRPFFRKDVLPSTYNEMAADTVPPRIREGFRGTVAKTDWAGLIWAVVLPSSVKKRITRLASTRNDGILTITSTCDVIFEAYAGS